MKISEPGRERIKGYEALRLKAYLPTPNDVPTVGYGHTGKDVKLGQIITLQHAIELFNADCGAVEACISQAIAVPLTQNQVDALASLIFNVGAGVFLGSHLRQAINRGDTVGIKANWLDWDHQGPVELAGLKARRLSEWKLFTSDV